MVTSKQDNSLDIFMNGILVGQLEKLPSGGLSFRYETNWLEYPETRPISLSLPLISKPYVGDVVYNFFENLLPDNLRIRARIQTRFHTTTAHPFDLLASIGMDCVGAIQIGHNKLNNIRKIVAEPLTTKAIAHLLKNYHQAPLGMSEETNDFRISIAGAQEKSALLFYKGKWCRPHGTTPTSHIFKLPIGIIEHQQMDLRDSCENEWICSRIAAAFHLPVASCEIQQFEDVKVLIVERFDRKWAEDGSWLMRLPQEDMCQALGYSPNLKYQTDGGPGIIEIMRLLLGSKQSADDRELFFRFQILFWLLAAIDGHAKNFSLFIEPGGRYRLTPLYDVISAHPLIAKKQLQKQKIKMAMALKGKNNHYLWHSIQRRHFISTAEAANYSTKKVEQILDEMLKQVDDVIIKVSKQLPKNFPKAIADPIFTGMKWMKNHLS